jgi:single-strand DNA-binding protein
MNNLSAIGNVGRDAEVRFTANGDAITSFSFALSSGYGDKAITTWINAVVFGKRGQTLAPMLTKGTRIGLNGELTTRPYSAKDGTEKFSLEVRVNDVTLLGAKPANQQAAPSSGNANFDESIPF